MPHLLSPRGILSTLCLASLCTVSGASSFWSSAPTQDVAVATDDRECHDEGSGSGSGGAYPPTDPTDDALTMMWATPIMKKQLIPEGDQLANANAAIMSEIMKGYEAWRGGAEARGERLCRATASKNGVNERFFRMQQARFDEGKVWGPLGKSEVVGQLRETIWQHIVEYARQAQGGAASAGDGDGHGRDDGGVGASKPSDIFIWATVHQDCIGHLAHIHESAVVSGVYYVNTPKGSGHLILEDPRGPRPPFTNRMMVRPRPGLLVLFPPWLTHSVAPTCSKREAGGGSGSGSGGGGGGDGGETLRVSLSFNLPGKWGATADASFVAMTF